MNEEKCSVCMEEKKQPVIFGPCKHSVCLKCYIEMLKHTRELKCPLCRQSVESFENDGESVEFIIASTLYSVNFSEEEIRTAQQELDRQFNNDMIDFRRDDTDQHVMKVLEVILPIITLISFFLVIVPVAQQGFFAMFCFALFVGSHLFHHKVMEIIRTRHWPLPPQRRFVNARISRLVNNHFEQ